MSAKPDFRAEWTSAYINNLPDSSFAYIESGGSKDDQGKTTPRSLRHFPIKNAEGQCDRAHTRNALSRAPQSPFGDKAMPKIRGCARALGIEVSESSYPRGVSSMGTERRFTLVPVEYRSADGASPAIGGYAAVFNSPSRNLGGFTERVDPAAFNRSASRGWEGVIARFNHDDNQLLGSTGGGTLRLHTDEEGLHYEVTPPGTRSGEDVVELVRRGDVRASSFAFHAIEDAWDTDDRNYVRRNLLSVDLVDVAPVVSPAYPETTVGLASLQRQFPDIPLEEIRSMAERDELKKLFVRSDGPGPKKPVLGQAAMAEIMGKRDDPLADGG